jgi:hypothetical protein
LWAKLAVIYLEVWNPERERPDPSIWFREKIIRIFVSVVLFVLETITLSQLWKKYSLAK